MAVKIILSSSQTVFPPAGILLGMIIARASAASILRQVKYYDVKLDDTPEEPLLGHA